MKDKKLVIVVLAAILTITARIAKSGEQVTFSALSDFRDREQRGRIIEATYNCQFERAFSELDEMIRKDTTSIDLKFFRAIVMWRSMYVNGQNAELEMKFERQMMELVDIGKDRLAKNERDTIALFYMGGACGYLARYYAAKDQSFQAVSWGKKGLNFHEELLTIAPQWFDAYLSLGLFHFYASGVPWYLKPILFLLGRSGSEVKAIEFLTLVSEKGELARFEAEEALAELYVRRGEHHIADSLYQDLITRFPSNLFYYQKSAVSLFELMRYKKVIEISAKGINQLSTPTPVVSSLDSFRVGFLYTLMAESYVKLNQLENALRVYKAFLERAVGSQFFSFAYLSSGRIYEKLEDLQHALECYRKVIVINRIAEHVKEARQRIEQISSAQ